MNTLKNNGNVHGLGTLRPALEIRFHFVDGSRKIFTQSNAEAADRILRGINKAVLFNQSRIVVADDYSKSVFVSSEINRIDFISDDPGFSDIPPDHVDMVELTETEFNQHVRTDDLASLEKREQHRQRQRDENRLREIKHRHHNADCRKRKEMISPLGLPRHATL